MTTTKSLTEAQERFLHRVAREGQVVQNGRARKMIQTLEDAGLVTVDWDMIPQAKGNGMELVERITVELSEKARADLERMTDVPEARGF